MYEYGNVFIEDLVETLFGGVNPVYQLFWCSHGYPYNKHRGSPGIKRIWMIGVLKVAKGSKGQGKGWWHITPLNFQLETRRCTVLVIFRITWSNFKGSSWWDLQSQVSIPLLTSLWRNQMVYCIILSWMLNFLEICMPSSSMYVHDPTISNYIMTPLPLDVEYPLEAVV